MWLSRRIEHVLDFPRVSHKIPFRSRPIGSFDSLILGWLVRAVHQDSNILIHIKNHFVRSGVDGYADIPGPGETAGSRLIVLRWDAKRVGEPRAPRSPSERMPDRCDQLSPRAATTRRILYPVFRAENVSTALQM